MYGEEIKNFTNIIGNEVKIFKDNLTNGIYFIYITEENKTIATDKLIIYD